MKSTRNLTKKLSLIAVLLTLTFIISPPPSAYPAVMEDYCITPPFVVGGGVQPNLLMTLDNSSSMYDLAYIDEGRQDAAETFTRDPSYCYDQTYKTLSCSNDSRTSCTVDADCPAGGECETNVYIGYFENGRCSNDNTITCARDSECSPGTCVDTIYEFIKNGDILDDGTEDGLFESGASFPALCSHSIPNTLCVDIDSSVDPKVVNEFIATGSYLNWLSSSKFDVQKRVLTGGKYLDKACSVTTSTSCSVDADCPAAETCVDLATDYLLKESRGCVGRRFLKEANTADFINYDDPETNNTNTSLGTTFAVRGPANIYNAAGVSPGGQTFIEIYEGDYGQKECQEAIQAIEDHNNPSAIRRAVEDCISYDATGGSKFCQLDPSFNGGSCTVDSDCDTIGVPGNCSGGPKDDRVCILPSDPSILGQSCVVNSDCDVIGASVGPCVGGADHGAEVKTKVLFNLSMQECWQWYDKGTPPSNDAWSADSSKCEEIYDGYRICDGGTLDGETCSSDPDCLGGGTCIGGPDAILPGNAALLCNAEYAGYCATTSDDWNTTTWVKREFANPRNCFLAKYLAFCGGVAIPAVTDPSDAPSDSGEFANVPAIIAEIGALAQLGEAIDTYPVKVKTNEPEGLIQEFNGLIRMGTMTFNYSGSSSECDDLTNFKCPRACSVNTSVSCTSAIDCPLGSDDPPGESCDPIINGADNLDGAQIIHYIGTPGECSVTTATACTIDQDCPDGETCNTVGDHTEGLVRSIDNIRADSWTPFSEAFYEAIGYFARTNVYDKPPVDLTGSISNPILSTDCQPGTGTGTSRDLRLNANRDYCEDTNPSQYKCQSNNILLISDGMATADQNTAVTNAISGVRLDGLTPAFPDDGEFDLVPGPTPCNLYLGSRNLDDLAWIAQNRDITDFSVALDDGSEQGKSIKTYAVFNGISATDEPGQCNPDTLLRDASETKGGGVYKRVEKPEELEQKLRELFETLAAKASSGTAASVLASGSGEGANLLQAIFYPKRFFKTSGDDVDWIGTLQNLWYYVDPRFGASAIREDTDGDNTQHLIDDYIVSYAFRDDKTVVDLFEDVNGDYSSLVLQNTIELEFLNNLWEAGTILWQRDITAAAPAGARTIKTSIDGSSMIDFKNEAASITALTPFLQAADKAEGEAIIRFTHGEDTRCVNTAVPLTSTFSACSFDSECTTAPEICSFFPAIAAAGVPGNYRTRTVRIDLNNDNDVIDAGEEAKVWKLGDIINSTPKVLSWVPINTYHTRYNDNTYKKFTCSDPFDAPCTSGYDDRGLIFSSSNDGMLHAFKLGKLELDWVGRARQKEFSRLTNLDATTPLGHENWAFIPKNALPYLKYVGDPGYCHLYIDDGPPLITDASIGGLPTDARPIDGSSWRTVLIGSMRYGGACRESNAPPCVDCVNAPGVDINNDGDKDDTIGGLVEAEQGLSSYFALDITDPDNPTFMWEFTDPDLGYSTAGASFIRINTKDASVPPKDLQNTNGDWFVVLPSGPTGPIDKPTKQFLARSDQDLRLFVLDLKTGTLLHTIWDEFSGSTIPNAFGGSSINAGIDYDHDYQDDIIYIPYIKNKNPVAVPGTDTWTDGGIARIYTDGSNDPTKWIASKLIDGIGAVSSAVRELKNKRTGKLWLFFGTGRYYFKKGSVLDDSVSERRIFGVKEPCFDIDIDTSCDKSYVQSGVNIVRSDDPTIKLINVTDVAADPPDANDPGWYINLAAKDPDFDAERVTTDPVATASQVVFFTTFRPSNDVCSFGGNSHLWGVKYDTGGCADDYLQGTALLQVSTGTIEQIDLKDVLSCSPPPPDDPSDPTPPDPDVPRKSPEFTGKPPEGPGLDPVTEPPPEERFMHIRER